MPPEAAAKPANRPPAVPADVLTLMLHEVRTPLAMIFGRAQLLQRRLPRLDGLAEHDRAALERTAIAIEASCRRLAATINHLDPTDPAWGATGTAPSGGPQE